MSAISINVKQVNVAGAGEKPWIPVNRFGTGKYSLHIIVSGVVTVDLEATLMKLNQDANLGDLALGPPAAEDIIKLTGGVGIVATVSLSLFDTPLEAIRVNQISGSGSVSLHVMQEA